MTQIFSSAVLPNVAKLSLVVFLYSTWVYRSVSCQTKKKDWFFSITSKELVDILRRLVVKCQGWTVSTTLLNAQTENLFWLYLQGVAGYQSTPRASRGENLNFFPLQIHLSILQNFQCDWWTGCWRLHPPPPWCPHSSRNGSLGPSWKEKDGRGLLCHN